MKTDPKSSTKSPNCPLLIRSVRLRTQRSRLLALLQRTSRSHSSRIATVSGVSQSTNIQIIYEARKWILLPKSKIKRLSSRNFRLKTWVKQIIRLMDKSMKMRRRGVTCCLNSMRDCLNLEVKKYLPGSSNSTSLSKSQKTFLALLSTSVQLVICFLFSTKFTSISMIPNRS